MVNLNEHDCATSIKAALSVYQSFTYEAIDTVGISSASIARPTSEMTRVDNICSVLKGTGCPHI
jgi:hypothetical protein